MKRLIILCTLYFFPLYLFSGITTYTFTSANWASKVDATVCDGKTDGWVCDKEATEYTAGRFDAQNRLYSKGVGVKTGTSGAGATSVLTFNDVRRITVNFCQNSSKGRGVIYVQIGTNEPKSIIVNKPAASGEGVYNRDSIVVFSSPESGKIRFWVDCTENAIYINSFSIRSSTGGSSVFTMDTYQLVTDETQLQDSDQIIFGVFKDGVNYIMGYFDEWESANNIHAIKGRYSADRMQVEPDERAIYTLRIADLNGQKSYIFQDELRYEEAYLVASGGQTKNRLAVWTDVVDTKTYGNYGFWDIQIENGGEALITNLGNSKSKIIQYNASNSPTLFACYTDRSQTPVCLYRRVEAMGDVAAIVAPFVNFGTTIDRIGARTIEVNANKLTEDISATLTDGSVFHLSTNVLDRDGDILTVSYDAKDAGRFVDTLVLRSGDVEKRVAVVLHRIQPMSIAETVVQPDYTTVFLNEVTVTKKYDNYIYVRDETGSMLLFDRGNGETGKRYGADVKAGDLLTGVTGRYINYFGVPEVSPSEQFNIGKNTEVLPEKAPEIIDSTDVCRYLELDSAVVKNWTELTYNGKVYAVENKFNLPAFIKDIPTQIFAIVSYDHEVVTLYIVKQEEYTNPDGIVGIDASSSGPRLLILNGVVVVETENGLFSLDGKAYRENK